MEIGYLMKDYNQTLLFAVIVGIGEGNGAIWVSRGWKDFFFFLHHQQRKIIIQNSKFEQSKQSELSNFLALI